MVQVPSGIAARDTCCLDEMRYTLTTGAYNLCYHVRGNRQLFSEVVLTQTPHAGSLGT